MEKNIFENAYFGKQYKTRDGRKAIYIVSEKNRYEFAIEGFCGTLPYILKDSICISSMIYDSIYDRRMLNHANSLDIVSEWQEKN